MDRKILNVIQTGEVMAVIPARSGSKGIVNKNIQALKSFPLIAYSIIASKLSKQINRTIVSTDDQEYAEIAGRYGAEVPFLRPKAISLDNSTDLEFMEHLIDWLYTNEQRVPEYFVHLRATCPLRDPEIIDDAITLIKKHPEATCLLSATKAIDILSPYKWLKKEDGIYYKSIFFDNNDDANMPRQSYPETYIPSIYVDVLTTRCIVGHGQLHGNKMVAYESPRTIDIDEQSDFDRVKRTLDANDFTVYKYLVENFSINSNGGVIDD